MCTAVVGGSIHRAATRISAASDQRSTTPMTSHRIKDRRKPVRSGVLVCVFGIAVTFQNDSLGGRSEMTAKTRVRVSSLVIRMTETASLLGFHFTVADFAAA